jgi:hypothetical protein
MLQKRNAVLVVIALVISSLNSIALPSAFAITPVAPGNLVMCKSLKTNYQYVSTTGACNNKIYETIKWYKKGSAPTGTPGSKLISLNTCQSKSTIGAIVLKAKCNIKTETTLLWQRPLGPPGAPIIKSVLPGKLGSAEIEYLAPENNGGARVLSYKALSNPGAFMATVQKESSGKITVTGLQPGTKYTFTVLATNSVGTSLASLSSLEMFAPTTANAPIIKSVEISGPDEAKIAFIPSDFDGGTPITEYEVVTHPYAAITHSVTSPGTIELTGLAPGTEYTFTLIACNSAGDSEESNTSNVVRTPVPVPAPDPVPVQSGGGTPSLTSQTLTIDSSSFTSTYAINAAAPTLTSTSSGGTGVKSYLSSTLAVCTINSSTGAVVFVSPGTCTVTASIAADSTYSSATSSSVSFTITLATQVLTWAPGTSLTMAQSPHTPSTLASGSASPAITYAITSAGTTGCTVNASTAVITYTGTGSCTVTVTAEATSVYASATKSVVFSIEQIEQAVSITSTAPVAAKVAGSTYALTATGGASGNSVTFASLTILICTVSGSTVSFIGVGTCTISADQAGNTNYSASPQVTQSFAVGKGDQAITPDNVSTWKYYGGSDFALPVASASSGLAITYSTSTPSSCSLSGTTVHLLARHVCYIQLNQAGNSNYNAALQVQYNYSIVQVPITLTAANQSTAYTGNAVTVTNSYNLTGSLVSPETITGVTYTYAGTGSTSYAPSVSAPTNAGTYSITPSAVTGLTIIGGNVYNYAITYIAGTLTISDGVASKVAITRASVGTARGTAFTTQPQITIQDSGSNTVIASSALVTASVSAGGTLVGTTTATASAGVATFTDLGVNGTIGTTYTITYTSGVLTVATATVTLTGTSCDGTLPCQVGDIGPGGGIVFYKDLTTGFNCGAAFSNTGSPTGGLCHYLEAAPNTWYGGSTDPQLVWANSENVSVGIDATDSFAIAGTPITIDIGNSLVGLGWYYSETIVAAHVAASKVATAALAAINYTRTYLGNTYSDWYLPNSAELNLLCQWKGAQTPTPGVACSGSGVGVGGFEFSAYLSSSISVLDPTGTKATGVSIQSFTWTPSWLFRIRAITGVYVRPVRSF